MRDEVQESDFECESQTLRRKHAITREAPMVELLCLFDSAELSLPLIFADDHRHRVRSCRAAARDSVNTWSRFRRRCAWKPDCLTVDKAARARTPWRRPLSVAIVASRTPGLPQTAWRRRLMELRLFITLRSQRPLFKLENCVRSPVFCAPATDSLGNGKEGQLSRRITQCKQRTVCEVHR